MKRLRNNRRVNLPWCATAELRAGPFIADASEFERIAARLHALTGSEDPRVFAQYLGIDIIEGQMPEYADAELQPDGNIRIRSHLSASRRDTAIAHELAHLLSNWHQIECTHPDVWIFTIALLRPGPLFARLNPSNDDADIAIILTSLALASDSD